MAFVTSQLETLGMIEQPVWLWYGDWNEQINIITQEKIRNLTLVWRLMKTQDHSSGDYCATLFNLVILVHYIKTFMAAIA